MNLFVLNLNKNNKNWLLFFLFNFTLLNSWSPLLSCLSTIAEITLFVLIRIAVFSIITLCLSDNSFLRFLTNSQNIWNLLATSSCLRSHVPVNLVWDASNWNAHSHILVSKIWRNERRFSRSLTRNWNLFKCKKKLQTKSKKGKTKQLIGMIFEKKEQKKWQSREIYFVIFISFFLLSFFWFHPHIVYYQDNLRNL